MPSAFGGNEMFGLAVRIMMAPMPSESQTVTFFGTSGKFRLFGGGRGRTFSISGLLYGSSIPSVAAARDTILSYDDGIGRVLYDAVEGTTWPSVVFTGAFSWIGDYGIVDDAGGVVWTRPYQAIFEGMI